MNHPYPTFLMGSQASPPNAAVLVPLLVLLIDVALMFYCLDDLNRRVIVAGGNKLFWAAVIILGSILGQVIYLLYGRGEY
jgi:hypothetical protein